MIEIVRYSQLLDRLHQRSEEQERISAEIDAIFFEASNTKSFVDEAARTAFRERWLGRYLNNHRDCAFIALENGADVAGYVVGALEDPALSAEFADVWHVAAFAHLSRRYPAHLHINIAAHHRNRGLGHALISRFVDDVRSADVAGVHVVTGAGARNVGFYQRNGFWEAGRLTRASTDVVFLGRDLSGT